MIMKKTIIELIKSKFKFQKNLKVKSLKRIILQRQKVILKMKVHPSSRKVLHLNKRVVQLKHKRSFRVKVVQLDVNKSQINKKVIVKILK